MNSFLQQSNCLKRLPFPRLFPHPFPHLNRYQRTAESELANIDDEDQLHLNEPDQLGLDIFAV